MKHLILLLTFFTTFLSAGSSDSSKSKLLTNDEYKYIAINQILMWVSNNGDGSHDPNTDGNGFYWPGGINNTGKSAIFEDGLIWGAKINGQVRVNGNTHRQGLQAGKINADGTPTDPSSSKYIVYKIRIGWENLPPGPDRDMYEYCYYNWPIDDGAPYVDIDGDGMPTPGVDLPRHVGDETLWYVSNDLDPGRTTFTYGSMPIGLEVQTTVFGYNNSVGQDVVFKKYRLINKGTSLAEDMYLGYWSDSDLGNGNDDYTGFSKDLNLGYTYNAVNNDAIYGSPPPAVGYRILQTPVIPSDPTDSAYFKEKWIKGYKNLPLSSFSFYINGSAVYKDPDQGNINGSNQFYNYLQGKIWDGSSFIDPNTAQPTNFVLSGDPEAGTGWFEGPGWAGGPPPGDRRHLMGVGPFNMAPGDTQEICIAILIQSGSNNLKSVTALKQYSDSILSLYGNYVSPIVTSVEDEYMPQAFDLMQNYPNPFNPVTTIQYSIAGSGFVELKVFDLLGKEAAVLVSKEQTPGKYDVTFDASNLASGIYFYQLRTGGFTLTKKLILLK